MEKMTERRSYRDNREGRDRGDRGDRDSRDSGDDKPRRPRGCRFCSDEKIVIDYKQEEFLRWFVGESKKILPRRLTNLCAFHQRVITRAVKKARVLGLLPFSPSHRQRA